MRIVGIDPGTNRIGYALLRGTRAEVELLAAETITIASGTERTKRLTIIAGSIAERLQRDRPDIVAIEELFFAKNVKTALSVAEARGVILLTAADGIRSIWEYTPLEVKSAVAGYGKADKAQILRMVKLALPKTVMPFGDDAVDAIAIALTAFYRGAPADTT
jgi:crossover junction endodeoxyribonuclease RuvC